MGEGRRLSHFPASSDALIAVARDSLWANKKARVARHSQKSSAPWLLVGKAASVNEADRPF